MLKQDDPKKCTAAKLDHFGIAKAVRRIPRGSIVLNPFSELCLHKNDRDLADMITAIDCSWEKAGMTFQGTFPGINRKLPLLLASNPTNYAKIGKLSTAEALAAGLRILGFEDEAYQVMNKFKWGHTFFELNEDLLSDYAAANSSDEIRRIEIEYFPELFQV